MSKKESTSVYIDVKLKERIARRGERMSEPGRGFSAGVDLICRRYFDLVAECRPDLSRNEKMLIVDVCNGWPWQWMERGLRHLTVSLNAEIVDGIRLNGLDEKWLVDATDLVAKASAWSPAEALAILDAVEEYWELVTDGQDPDIDEIWTSEDVRSKGGK